ncbi:MAG: RnfABCDGE type electron transport complex subunit G [Elusimicrobia bacterium]|nr:RnfABCDGE type electron transport complex subunit G [Elusimicrobiota bacterium]MBD3412452.1 RnfABCDGE type electron transport complex subunit G [Elusimicrobiota bacterium]
MKRIFNLSLRLAILCIVASAGLSSIYQLTADKIVENQRIELENKLKQVLPEADRFEEVSGRFIGYHNGEQVGIAVRADPQGYGGPISMLIGIDTNDTVTGIAIISHKETPGLGKKIENDAFREQFEGKKDNQVKLNKDSSEGTIDAITAATISSRAVARAVYEALEKDKP